MIPKHGGYAFPKSDTETSGGNYGMTLRDYFAAKAMNGLLARGLHEHHVAALAYNVADAMLAERNKETPR